MKKVFTLNPVSFMLRLEVGLPFLDIIWPFSLLASVVFVFLNAIAEKRYANYAKYWQKFLFLGVMAILNGVVYTLAVIIKSPPVHPYEQTRFYVNYIRIEGEIGTLLIISLLLVYCRAFALLIEWIVTLLKKYKHNKSPH